METRTLGKDLEVSALGLGCMSMSSAYGPPPTDSDMVALIRARARSRRDPLRHRRGLWSVHQRGAGGRGAGADPRQGGHRHQVRLRHRPRDRRAPRRHQQPARAHQGRSPRRASSGSGPTGSTSSTSTASIPTCRSRTWPARSKELIAEGKVRHFGLSEAGVRHDPPRACGPAGDGGAERILAVLARPGGGAAAAARGARDRLRAVQPARRRLPDRQDRRDDDVRRRPTSATTFRASRRRRARPTWRWSISSRAIAAAQGRDAGAGRARLAAGAAGRGSCRSPAPPSCIGWRRTSARSSVTLTKDDLAGIDEAASRIAIQGDRLPEAALKMTGL